MPEFSTEYTPAGVTTKTSAPQLAGIQGLDPHLRDMANQIFKMKLAAAQRREQDEIAARYQGATAARIASQNGGQAPTAPRSMPTGSVGDVLGGSAALGRGGTTQQQMQELALRDALNQTSAKERPGASRYVTGANVIPGTVLDPIAMSGYEREAHLPQNSSGRF